MKRKSKLLAVAVPLLLILTAVVVYQYGYLRVETERKDAEEKAALKGKMLEKYVNLIASKPQLEAYLAELKEKRIAQKAKMVEGATPSIAAASLQNTVKTMITARGGTISSERAEKPEDLGKFKVISVSVDAVFPDTRSLCDVLFTMETQVPYIVVHEMDARIRNYKDPRDLAVKLKVSAVTGGR